MLYRTGNILIDPANFILSEDGAPISVEPQVFNLIVYLVGHRERLITRQEIFDELWADRVVSDTSLSNHIKSARKALGDDGQKQQVIKTVHGRGYQFIADVEPLDSAKDENKEQQSETQHEDKSIAVLAFADLSPQGDQEYFSDGITDELIILLARIPELRVISRTSSFSFKGKHATSKEIGQQLSARHILEGSVRKAGDQLRINTQLIRVSDESHIWSETYNRQMENIFEIQDDIAQSVVRQLKIALLGNPASSNKLNPRAYELYLEARYLHRKFTRESMMRAEKQLLQSIDIEPEYAPAWCLLARIIGQASINLSMAPENEARPRILEALGKTIDLDPDYALGFVSLAYEYGTDREFDLARENLQKALDLDSSNTDVLDLAAIVSVMLGNITEAVSLLNQAIELDPLNYVIYYNLSLFQLLLNQPEEAERTINKYIRHLPEAELGHGILTWSLILQDRPDEALQVLKKEPNEKIALYSRIAILFLLDQHEEAQRLLNRFIEQIATSQPSLIASLYAFRNKADEAFHWLDIALEINDRALVQALYYPLFRPIKSDTRWPDFIQRLNLPAGHCLLETLAK